MLDNMKDEILSELRCTVATLQSTVSSHVVKIQEVEEGLNDEDGRVAALERSYADLKAESEKLSACVDDQENRSQRQNIRVVGLPEKIEGSQLHGNFLGEGLRGGELPS